MMSSIWDLHEAAVSSSETQKKGVYHCTNVQDNHNPIAKHRKWLVIMM